ncbi:DNRLRE domain-containing protein [Streptomyces laurentii]|uniref:DNRLRE domain-containing protein n=1 Tax=Streptomyces laurentii TaxID=39478 RepID=UPI0036B7AFA9
MDASRTTKNAEPSSAETTSPMPPPAQQHQPNRKRRRTAALATLLAAALAVPLAVHLTADSTVATAPESRPKSQKRPREDNTSAQALEKAKRTGKDVIVTEAHTATSTTWAQPDGLLRTRIHSDTVRAKTKDGWKSVDTTLRQVRDGYAPRAVNDALLFSAGTPHSARATTPRTSRTLNRLAPRQAVTAAAADEPAWTELVRLTTEGHDLTVSWPGPLPQPVVNGSRALYENVRPGIDLLLTARDNGYSHVLVVRTPEAAQDHLLRELDYRLSSPSLSFSLDGTTHVVSARDEDGEEMATAPTPYLWDSAGSSRTTAGEPSPPIDPDTQETSLGLPGIAGPQPGSHDAVLGATLGSDNTLGITVQAKTLTDPDLVYPVFIDPSFKGHKKSWTLLYDRYPSSSFYNGQNFNDGTNEARIGYESTTGGTSRSVFNFDFSSILHGVTVKSAAFHALQTYSWGCASRKYDVYLTSAINSTHTWNKQPTWERIVGNQTNGYGYKADTCPDKWVAVSIKSTAQEAATKKWSQITLGLRASNEDDTDAWKKFIANGETAPYIDVVYNRPPTEPAPSAMSTTPGGACDYTAPFPSIGLSDVMFRAKGTDIDGNLRYVHIKVWPTGDTTHPVVDANYGPTSDGTATTSVAAAKFVDGTTYSWTAYTIDAEGATSAWGPSGTTAYCQFTVDKTAPTSPVVTSALFPESGDDQSIWSTVTHGTPGVFSFFSTGDVACYEYNFNAPRYSNPCIAPKEAGKAADSPPLSPPLAGPNTLYVRARDKAGNVSSPTTYSFFVRPRPGKDKPGDTSGDGIPDLYTVDDKGVLQLWTSSGGDLDSSMPAAYTTEDGKSTPAPEGYWTGALLSHTSDWFPGDGVNDLLARTKGSDGTYRLDLYPGDGYGSFDISKRIDVLLPSGAPAPVDLKQIVAVNDATGDGYPDAMATTKDGALWAFTGYTGGAFQEAKRLVTGAWADRDIFIAGDVSGDGILDLVFRNNSAGELRRREGKPNISGAGTDISSLATAAVSATPTDPVYSLAPGWQPSEITLFQGTPDLSGDGIPDFWAMYKTGVVRFYRGGRTAHESAYDNVIVAADGLWTDKVAFG